MYIYVVCVLQELTEDLMAIVHVFSCRFNGRRRYTRAKQGGTNSTGGCIQTSERQKGEGQNESQVRQGAKKRRRKSHAGHAGRVHTDTGTTQRPDDVDAGCTQNLQPRNGRGPSEKTS